MIQLPVVEWVVVLFIERFFAPHWDFHLMVSELGAGKITQSGKELEKNYI